MGRRKGRGRLGDRRVTMDGWKGVNRERRVKTNAWGLCEDGLGGDERRKSIGKIKKTKDKHWKLWGKLKRRGC